MVKILRIPLFISLCVAMAAPALVAEPACPEKPIDRECYTGTWVSLNRANIDGASMRAREFSLTRIEPVADGKTLVTKQSYVLGGNGDYLVYEDTMTGTLHYMGDRAILQSGDIVWRLKLERKGQNGSGSFSYYVLSVDMDEGSVVKANRFFEDDYYRVNPPDTSVLKGNWEFSEDRSNGPASYTQYSTIHFNEGSTFDLDDSFWRDLQEGNRKFLRDLKGEGFWTLSGGRVILEFEKARPYTMEGKALALHFLGFNGNQMRLIDERGFLWKLQKVQ